jgi:hypothetical protein
MRLAALVAGLLLLVGCTRVLDISGSEWRKANASIQQVTYDEVECARASEKAGDLPPTIVGGAADAVVRILEDRRRGAAYDACMRSLGYEQVAQTAVSK